MNTRSKKTFVFITAILLAATLGYITGNANARPEAISVAPLLKTSKTISGQTISYPSDGQPQITAAIVTIQPGAKTGWHAHDVPLFGYILQGEIEVEYGSQKIRTYQQGDALMEAINEPHNGTNKSNRPVKILAVFMGTTRLPNTITLDPPQPNQSRQK